MPVIVFFGIHRNVWYSIFCWIRSQCSSSEIFSLNKLCGPDVRADFVRCSVSFLVAFTFICVCVCVCAFVFNKITTKQSKPMQMRCQRYARVVKQNSSHCFMWKAVKCKIKQCPHVRRFKWKCAINTNTYIQLHQYINKVQKHLTFLASKRASSHWSWLSIIVSTKNKKKVSQIKILENTKLPVGPSSAAAATDHKRGAQLEKEKK